MMERKERRQRIIPGPPLYPAWETIRRHGPSVTHCKEAGMDERTPRTMRSGTREKAAAESGRRKSGPPLAGIAVLAAVLAAGLFAVVRDRPCPTGAGLVSGDVRPT